MTAVTPADGPGYDWAAARVAESHYLRSVPDPRGRPFCHVVTLAGERVGCLWWGRPEASRCYVGGLTYGSTADQQTGRAAFDRWEVLNLSRVWLAPAVQQGGDLWRPGVLPGYVDRRGVWRSTLASEVIRLGLARVGADYLLADPPPFTDEPYVIRAVLSYCDTARHRGTIYRAAGFSLARTNAAGIETWWTPTVAPLTPDQDAAVRAASATSPKCRRHRESRRSLFA